LRKKRRKKEGKKESTHDLFFILYLCIVKRTKQRSGWRCKSLINNLELRVMRKKKFKERTPIEVIVKVETLKNGYSLDVDGKEYLYFDVVELAKGLILHAGLGRTSPTTKFGRDSLLKAIGNGSAEKKLQQEINKLQEEVTYLHNKLYGYKKEQKRD
jgi:hypothetical protein